MPPRIQNPFRDIVACPSEEVIAVMAGPAIISHFLHTTAVGSIAHRLNKLEKYPDLNIAVCCNSPLVKQIVLLSADPFDAVRSNILMIPVGGIFRENLIFLAAQGS